MGNQGKAAASVRSAADRRSVKRRTMVIGTVIALSPCGSPSAFALALPASGSLSQWMTPSAGTGTSSLRNRLESLQNALRSVATDRATADLVANPKTRLAWEDTREYAGVATTRLQVFHQGLEVLGGEILRHEGPAGTETAANLANFDVSTTPRIRAEEAAALAQNWNSGKALSAAPVLRLAVLGDNQTPRLIYQAAVKSEDIAGGSTLWVDAVNGEVIANVPDRLDIAPIHVVEMSSKCQDVDARSGSPLDYNPSLCRQTVRAGVVSPDADASARRAFSNADKVARYYLDHHNRDSYDGQGGQILNLVHIGEKFSNAFWSTTEKLMAYGDGDGEELGDFTLAVDVAGHEMTHGVVSATAKLAGFGEHGALNEAFADIFGKYIAQDQSWAIGKGLFLDPSKAEGIRDLEVPGRLKTQYMDPETGTVTERAYPAHMNEMFPTQGPCHPRLNDKCWVHVNATIIGHAAYRITQAIGQDQAEKIFYLVMSQYLRPTSTFTQASAAIKRACMQLNAKRTCDTVRTQLAAVGL